jgi:hypothetical protein
MGSLSVERGGIGDARGCWGTHAMDRGEPMAWGGVGAAEPALDVEVGEHAIQHFRLGDGTLLEITRVVLAERDWPHPAYDPAEWMAIRLKGRGLVIACRCVA